MLIIEKVKKVKTPDYGTEGSAGIDFYIPDDIMDYCDPLDRGYDPKNGKGIMVPAGRSLKVGTGIKAHIPKGFVLIAFNKSGVALNKKFQVGACVIDSDYRGEIHIHFFNHNMEAQIIFPGEKIIQFVLLPYVHSEIMVGEVNNITERGENGFGSTGT